MKRIDIYLIGLAILNLSIFGRVLLIISAGPGLSMMGVPTINGHFTIALFGGTFIIIFANLARLIPIIIETNKEDSDKVWKDFSKVAFRSLGAIILYIILEFLQALSYQSMSLY